jgi:hypothetical protein
LRRRGKMDLKWYWILFANASMLDCIIFICAYEMMSFDLNDLF